MDLSLSVIEMEMCRACLSTNKDLIPINEPFIINYNLLTNLKVAQFDGMPQYFCQSCLDAINYFITFREKCITSENTLQELICENVKDEKKITEDAKTIKEEIKEEIQDNNSNLDYCINESCEILDDDFFLFIKKEVTDDLTPKKSRRTRSCKRRKIARKQKIVRNFEETSNILLCGLCPKTFNDKDSLSKHLDNHKNNNYCDICNNLSSNWPQTLAHRLTHIPKKQSRCHVCNKRMASHLHMEHHYLHSHYEGEVKGLLCNQCSRYYETPRKLQKHILHVHSEKVFICDVCSKKFNNKQALVVHMRSHSDVKQYICDLCGYSSKQSSNLKEHKIRKHIPTRCYCKICRKVFQDQKCLDEHKCQQKFKVCPICGKQGINSNRFKSHLENHAESGRYKCNRCPATYKTRDALKVHLNRHDGIRTKQCEYCHAKFYSTSVLIKHRRIHTGEKPYVCKVCQKGFTGNNNLKVHMKVHGEMLIIKKNKEV